MEEKNEDAIKNFEERHKLGKKNNEHRGLGKLIVFLAILFGVGVWAYTSGWNPFVKKFSVTTSNIHANDGLEKIFDLMYSGFKYGYSLPKAADYSAAGLARSGNSQKCAKLKYIVENRYCILGVVFKAMDKPEPSRKEILSYDIEKVTELSRMPFMYIGYEHLTRTRK